MQIHAIAGIPIVQRIQEGELNTAAASEYLPYRSTPHSPSSRKLRIKCLGFRVELLNFARC